MPSRTLAFKPEHHLDMQWAINAVGAKLRLPAGMGDAMTELVAPEIIELARAASGIRID
jgi:hypothetical protein